MDSTLEDMMETIALIAERSRKAGKHAAIYVLDAGLSGRLVKMGYRLLAMGSEQALVVRGKGSAPGCIPKLVLPRPD